MKKVYLPGVNHFAHFVPREEIALRAAMPTFSYTALPPTQLPVDSSGSARVSCPMYANDQYGDCGAAMAAHVDNILTFRQGKATQSTFDVNALVQQYLKVSGGDHGLTEDMVVNRIWKLNIAGNTQAIIVDALDIDITNVPLAQYAIDQFYTIQMAWSVPDAFIKGFTGGSVWAAAGIPNRNNGHYTPLSDIGGPQDTVSGTNIGGFYRVWTWGKWCWVSPTFVRSVQPQCFIAFSPRQFDLATGLDSKGRHITTQANVWRTCGGKQIPLSVINAFPPIGEPGPGPGPGPGPIPPPDPIPLPPPTPPLFSLTFSKQVPAGNRVTFTTPVDIPAGTYNFTPVSGSQKSVPVITAGE